MKNISGVVRHLTALLLYTAPMQYTSTWCTLFSTFFQRLKDNDRKMFPGKNVLDDGVEHWTACMT